MGQRDCDIVTIAAIAMSIFHFQQFSVRQTDSAMKICTVSTLFGAMAPIRTGDRVLDIGTGTGLLGLMAAQLGAGRVTGVELNEAAYTEARLNFYNSRWRERLVAVHASIQTFAGSTTNRYDLIISNPPFFDNHSKSRDPLRRQARHSDSLSSGALLACVDRLLTQRGLFYVLLPSHAAERFTQLALERELYLCSSTDIRTYATSRAKVAALTYSRRSVYCNKGSLTIYQTARVYAKASADYLSPFLLRFAPRA
jgi:tRNA1Val (adenine37-N6)-methyltransferase